MLYIFNNRDLVNYLLLNPDSHTGELTRSNTVDHEQFLSPTRTTPQPQFMGCCSCSCSNAFSRLRQYRITLNTILWPQRNCVDMHIKPRTTTYHTYLSCLITTRTTRIIIPLFNSFNYYDRNQTAAPQWRTNKAPTLDMNRKWGFFAVKVTPIPCVLPYRNVRDTTWPSWAILRVFLLLLPCCCCYLSRC